MNKNSLLLWLTIITCCLSFASKAVATVVYTVDHPSGTAAQAWTHTVAEAGDYQVGLAWIEVTAGDDVMVEVVHNFDRKEITYAPAGEVTRFETRVEGLAANDRILVKVTPNGSSTFRVGYQIAISTPTFDGFSTYPVGNYGAVGDGSTDDFAAVQSAVAAAINAGGGVVTFDGTKTYRVIGSTSLTVEALFDLYGARNIKIEGNGAKLVMYPPDRLAEIQYAENIQVDGFTIDLDPLPYYQGTITNINVGNRTIDITVPSRYPVPAVGAVGSICTSIDGRGPFFGRSFVPDGPGERSGWGENIYVESTATNGGPRLIRIQVPSSCAGQSMTSRLQTAKDNNATEFVVPDLSYGHRNSTTRILHSSRIKLSNLRYTCIGHFWLTIQHNDGPLTLSNVDLTMNNPETELLASWRDGMHIKNSRWGILIEDGDWDGAAMYDDTFAIYSRRQVVVSKSGSVVTLKPSTGGRESFLWQAGDWASFWSSDQLTFRGMGRVVSVEDASSPNYEVTLESIPAGVGSNDIVLHEESLNRNTVIRDSRTTDIGTEDSSTRFRPTNIHFLDCNFEDFGFRLEWGDQYGSPRARDVVVENTYISSPDHSEINLQRSLGVLFKNSTLDGVKVVGSSGAEDIQLDGVDWTNMTGDIIDLSSSSDARLYGGSTRNGSSSGLSSHVNLSGGSSITYSAPPADPEGSYYLTTGISATASDQYNGNRVPGHAVDGSGMTGSAHSNGHPSGLMWMGDNSSTPKWFKIDLSASYDVTDIDIYNFNWSGYTSRGCKNVNVYYSNSGSDPGNPVDNAGNWTAVGSAFDLTQAPGASDYGTTNSVDPDTVTLDVTARWISLKINSDHGGGYSGLSEVRIRCADDKAYSPAPVDGSIDVHPDGFLSWSGGTAATGHDLYLGTSESAITNADHQSSEFVGTLTDWGYDPGGLAASTTYYWAVDEVYSASTSDGDIWQFTTYGAPGQASNPVPANGAAAVSAGQKLSWDGVTVADSYDIYFGTTSPGTFQGNQTGTTFTTPAMAESTTYYWAVDPINVAGTATGSVWSFTTGSEVSSTGFTATASDYFDSDHVPDYVVDGSGMTGLAHSKVPVSQMWLGDSSATPKWFKVDLGASYDLEQMVIYNFNWAGYTNSGSKNVTVYYSNSSTDPGNPIDNLGNWTTLGAAFDLTEAPGANDYGTANSVAPDVVDLNGATARWVSLKINSDLGGGFAGLSEILFYEEGTIDLTAPTPNAATFSSVPSADSATAISMTATTGADATGPVEYYFAETSGNPGGTDSGWQTSASYTDSGLNASTQYTYTVQMRDSVATPNVGTASAPASATTNAVDIAAPNPNPATFSSAPSADSSTAISMTATTGTDASGPVEYYFAETSGNPGGTDSGWQTSTSYTDSGLTMSTQYTYTVQMRDSVATPNVGTASSAASATTTTVDTDPPNPNPAAFSSAPSADSSTAISMTATTGTDASGPVEYFFDETSGNPGGTDSGWQTSASYTDSGLSEATQYSYTIQMRDSAATPNVGTASSVASATTDDVSAPTPNAATWASAPSAVSDTAISMTATTGTDLTGPVEYYFDETTGGAGATDSGWQTSPSYTDTGLTGNTQYSYTVQLRDSASTPNVGTASSPANATTDATQIGPSGLTATASTYYTGARGPAKAIDGSGMVGLAHENGNASARNWMSADNDVANAWFKVDLGASYDVGDMVIYNFNWSGYTIRGCKNVTVYYSNSGSDPGNPVDNPGNWTAYGSAFNLTQAPGASDYGTTNSVAPDVVDFSGTTARWISLKINSGHGAIWVGLSEILFYED